MYANLKIFQTYCKPSVSLMTMNQGIYVNLSYFKHENMEEYLSLKITSDDPADDVSSLLAWDYIGTNDLDILPLRFYSGVLSTASPTNKFKEIKNSNSFFWLEVPDLSESTISISNLLGGELYNYQLPNYSKYTVLDFSDFKSGDLLNISYDAAQLLFFVRRIILASDEDYITRKELTQQSIYQSVPLDPFPRSMLEIKKLNFELRADEKIIDHNYSIIDIPIGLSKNISRSISPIWLISDTNNTFSVSEESKKFIQDNLDKMGKLNKDSCFTTVSKNTSMNIGSVWNFHLNVFYPIEDIAFSYTYLDDSDEIKARYFFIEGTKLSASEQGTDNCFKLTYSNGSAVEYEINEVGFIKAITNPPIQDNFIKPFTLMIDGRMVYEFFRPLYLKEGNPKKIIFSEKDILNITMKSSQIKMDFSSHSGEDPFQIIQHFLDKTKISILNCDLLYFSKFNGSSNFFSNSKLRITILPDDSIRILNHSFSPISIKKNQPIFKVMADQEDMGFIGTFKQDYTIPFEGFITVSFDELNIVNAISPKDNLTTLYYEANPIRLVEHVHEKDNEILTPSVCMQKLISGDYQFILRNLEKELDGYIDDIAKQSNAVIKSRIPKLADEMREALFKILQHEVVMLNPMKTNTSASVWLNKKDQKSGVSRRDRLSFFPQIKFIKNILDTNNLDTFYNKEWPKKPAQKITVLLASVRFITHLLYCVKKFIQDDYQDIDDEIYKEIIRAFRFRYQLVAEEEERAIKTMTFGKKELRLKTGDYGVVKIIDDI